MSQSTDGILVYGIALKSEALDEYDEDDESAQNNLLATMNHDDATVDGCKLVMHCSDAYPMHILAIPETIRVAYRGSPKVIVCKEGSPFAAPLRSDEILRAFLVKHGLTDQVDTDVNGGKPAWLLCSWWG